MNDRYDELHDGLSRLRDTVLEQLSGEDQRQLSEFIDANEFGVALEYLLDALAETNRKLPRSALPLVEELAKKMDMYPAILSRLPPELIEPP